MMNKGIRLFFEEILDVVHVDHFFIKGIRSALFGFNHLYALYEIFTLTGTQCCNYFLCHFSVNLFNFSMNSHFSQNRIELLKFKPVRSVLPVFSGNVSGSTRHTAFLMFGAFKYNLYPVSFSFLSHFLILLRIINKLR